MPITPRGRLIPDLPAVVWTYLACKLAISLGSGLVFPLTLVYLHGVRGLSLTAAGAIWGVRVVLTVAGSLLGGRPTHRTTAPARRVPASHW